MKAKKIIMAALCCFSVFSLVSCNLNDDNGNTGLSPVEIKTAYTAVKDIHSGKLIYAPIVGSKNDTLGITWDINTDSTMTIHNFPVSALADNIGSDYSDLKAALEKEGLVDLRCNIGFCQLNPVSFLINPISPSFNVSYGGVTHKIQIAFYLNTTYSAGVYQNKGILEMQIVEAGIYIDGSPSSALSASKAFHLVSCNQNETAYYMIKDIHSGKLIYAPIVGSKNDTLGITWDINTDSTMTIHNFPVSALADNIGSDPSDLKAALEKEGPVDLHCNIGFYQVNPVSFLINPILPSFNVSYGGATHKVQVAFYLNTTYSGGIYNYQNNGILEMQIIEAGIYIDGSQSSALSTSKAFLIDSTK